MKTMPYAVCLASMSAALFLVAGCDSQLAQVAGKLVTINGQPSNEYFKGVMDQLNAQQKSQLQAQSPQTLETLQHNDQVAKQQAAPAAAADSGKTPQTDAPTPLKVDDIKAMTAAGMKPQSIIDAINESKTLYSPADIDTAQQASPSIAPEVIACMKSPTRG